jgi:hypothetical protein
MIGAILTATVLMLQAAPATTAAAPTTTPAAAPSSTVSPVTVNGRKASAKPDGSEVVCHSEPVLGTLFPKRICARRDEFAERARQDQKEVREMTNLRPYKIPE